MGCILTNGGEHNLYFDGARLLTPRELARCQSFPDDFEFRGSCLKRQIGNSLAPVFAKAVYGCVLESLERSDGLKGEVVVGRREEMDRREDGLLKALERWKIDTGYILDRIDERVLYSQERKDE